MSTEKRTLIYSPEQRARDAAHVQSVVDAIIAAEPNVEFGERDGPCVVEYRDWWVRGWPMRRDFSCLGCRWHEQTPEFWTSYCEHPTFLEKYGCHQSIANNHWWRRDLADVHAFSCPVLRLAGVAAHCPSIAPDEIPDRKPSKAYRLFPDEKAEIFTIPQQLPDYVREAYERGERVDSQTPRY